MTSPKQPTPEEEELLDFENQLVVAWPGPSDPPPRAVRLPGMRITPWPQKDGSVLYEIKYRGAPYEPKKKKRRHRDTVQMSVPWNKDDKK